MLDGLGTVEHYVNRAVELGQPAIALTDHGNLCGSPSFYRAARAAGIEPILGEEFYFVEDADARPVPGEAMPERHHVTVLARGQRGYEVLAELSTETHRNFYHKPLLDVNMVEALGDDAQHLVVLSGCAGSVISHAVRAKEMDLARQWTMWWRESFPHFYIELMHHDTDFDLQLNSGLVKLAKKYNIPHVVTNDPHYVIPEDDHYHDTLLAIQTAADVDDPNRFRFDGHGYHLRSRAELARVFRRNYGDTVWKDGAAESLRIARMCHTRIPQWESRTWHIPKFADVEDSYVELKRLAVAGLKERGLERDPVYRQRVQHELKAFKEVGISDFLLITRDCINWAVEQGIAVGPGRGSVCGTLVGFLIGIHKIDPVRYELLFERFLNPARPAMPDIDTDFEPARRHEMYEYVTEKYGAENCVHVAAYQNMKTKSAFRSLARAHGVSFVDANRLAKKLPDLEDDDVPGDDMPSSWPLEFHEEIEDRFPDLYRTLVRLSGVKRALAAHPAGIVIANPSDHIRKLVPQMYLASSKRMCGQYDLDAVEAMGLMKQDFLGLRTLSTIRECVDLVEESTGKRLDPDSWVPDEERNDRKVYRLLGAGKTAGIFQMEGPTNQAGIKAVGCTCFEDIVSTTSLYRTGAISAGFPKIFIKNRKLGDTTKIKYAHPALAQILDHTWGVVIYQEQCMEMGLVLANFNMELVDDIKEAIKHKKSTLMKELGKKFVAGCQSHTGMTKKQAETTWSMIEGYSGYGYNRSHAVAYTFVTYQTARLKALYPKEFIAALLRTVDAGGKGKEKRQTYLTEARAMGLEVYVPDINESIHHTTVTDDGIRFGFSDLKGIGEKQAAKIVAGRPEDGYESIEQVEAAVRNVGVMRALADVGAFECFGVDGSDERASELCGWQFTDLMEPIREEYADKLIMPGEQATVRLIGMIERKFSGTAKNQNPYMTWHIRWDATNAWNIRLWHETSDLWDLEIGDVVQVDGKWEAAWENVSVGDPARVKPIRRKDAKDD